VYRRIVLAVTRLLHDRLIRRWDIPQRHLPRFARHMPRVLVLYDTGTIAIDFLLCSKVMPLTGCGFPSQVVPVRLGHRSSGPVCAATGFGVRRADISPRTTDVHRLGSCTYYVERSGGCIVQGSVKMGLLATNSITSTGREIRVTSVLIHNTYRVQKRCDIVPHTAWRQSALCKE